MCVDGQAHFAVGLMNAELANRFKEKTHEVKFPEFGKPPIEGEVIDITHQKRIARDPDPSLPAS